MTETQEHGTLMDTGRTFAGCRIFLETNCEVVERRFKQWSEKVSKNSFLEPDLKRGRRDEDLLQV